MNSKNAVAFLLVFVISAVAAAMVYFTVLKEDDKSDKVGGNSEYTTQAAVEQHTTEGTTGIIPTDAATGIDESTTTESEEATQGEAPTDKPVVANPELVKVDDSYFEDALFIGDSRTVGLYEYGHIEGADFFASSGMSAYDAFSLTLSVDGVGKTTLEELLNSKKYGKIYVMVGINEIGDKIENRVAAYQRLVDKIRSIEPNAILYIEANLHVTHERSESDAVFNNSNINEINAKIRNLSDNKMIFYIDVNENFDDSNNALREEITQDGIHPLGRYYSEWGEWLKNHAVKIK